MTNQKRWLITITIMMITIIELLDMTIVVVALNAMMGSLSADRNQITWVITAYIVSAAIVILLTGYLTQRFGRRPVLLTCVTGFLTSSLLCGVSTSLMMIVIFRIFQGMFGAVFIPSSQAILKAIFDEKDQGMAMAIWGMGLMLAPIMGPTIGGFITEHASWRWIFYVNTPFCILAFIMIRQFIEDTPKKTVSTDWLGMLLIIIGIGSLQLFLDQGNRYNWFSSHFIVILALISIITLTGLFYHCLTKNNPILNLRLLGNYNFTLCLLILMCYFAAVLGSVTLQPIMMEQLMHYPAETTGLLLAPRGIASAIAMILVGRFSRHFDLRWFVALGIAITLYGTFMMSEFSLQTSQSFLILSASIQGFGMGLSIVPIATLCTQKFKKQDLPQATAIFSFGRSLGNALGISLLSTLLFRETQINWQQIASHLTTTSEPLKQWLISHQLTLKMPETYVRLGDMVYQQASMIAFIDVYWISAVLLILLLPFVYFLKTK